MRKNNILGVVLIIVLTLGLLLFYWYLNPNEQEKSPKDVTIGVILPETHKDYASYAKQLKKGMLTAQKAYNNTSPDSLILIFEDGAGQPNNTTSAFNKLIDIDKTSIVIGPMFSNTAEAIAPIANIKKTVLLSPSASAINLSNAGKYFFRIYPSDNYDGKFLASFINKEFSSKKVAIINEKASSIDQIISVFKENLDSEPIFESSIDNSASSASISIELNKIKALNPDVIFFPGNKNFMSEVLKKSKEIGLLAKFVTISTFNDEELLKSTKGFSEGVMFSTPMYDPNNNSNEMLFFKSEYQKFYNEQPDILAGYGYDVVNIALEGAKGTMEPDSIVKNLLLIKEYPGVTGTTSFDKNGDVIKSLEMKIVKNNKFVRYE